MLLHVALQPAVPGKALGAQMALVWALTAVLAGVKQQVVSSEESCTTHLTHEWLGVGMQLAVSSQAAVVGEGS